jgi:hypothetical protein
VSTRDTDSNVDPFPGVHALLGIYQATLEFQSLQGLAVHGKVTVEGSAMVVEQVIAAAAGAFREDAER